MSVLWFYSDRSGQQQGPVDADAVRQAVLRGELKASSLAWREGLGEWQTLGQLAPELGLVFAPPAASMPSASPPPRAPAPVPAATHRTVAVPPKSGTSALVIILIVGVFGGIAVLGILAAIAIPAYQDYTVRARVMEGLNVATPLRQQVQATWSAEQRCIFNDEDGIKSEADYASQFVEKVIVGTLADNDQACAIEVTYRSTLGLSLDEAPRILMYLQDGDWVYESTIPARNLPTSVRDKLAN